MWSTAVEQIRRLLSDLLSDARLAYTDLHVTGTPRRLIAYVTGLAPRQTDETLEKRGPALDRAYDADGRPTRAAQGFAAGQGVPVEDLVARDNYVYAVKRVAGRSAADVLPQVCIALLEGLRWNKAMRWNSSGIAYPRPLRWIVALYGERVIPFAFAGVVSGRTSRGPRYADAAAGLEAGEFTTFEVAGGADYFAAVAAQGVVVNREERRRLIQQLVQDAAAQANGYAPEDPDLLDEVTDLVESPQALLGRFEDKYLELPMPVLIGVMKKHQRYFPVLRDGRMLPYFITVANARALAQPDVVTAGNEGVIRARYADAAYFYRQDTARDLDSFTPRLGTLTFHERLGSMLDKVERLKKLAPRIASMLDAGQDDVDVVTRAAALCKSDLVTSMVVEMTSLQGVMGEIYARHSGEPEAVAQAIGEHYRPRTAGDAAFLGRRASPEPRRQARQRGGPLLQPAPPTGSADPFGLRRCARHRQRLCSPRKLTSAWRKGWRRPLRSSARAGERGEFGRDRPPVARRLQGVLAEAGYAFDVVEAASPRRESVCGAAGLQRLAVGQRTVVDRRIHGSCAPCPHHGAVGSHARTEPRSLPGGCGATAARRSRGGGKRCAGRRTNRRMPGKALRSLQEPINAFFDAVLVNAEDETLRAARLALVQHIAALAWSVADLSKLQGF